MHTMFLGMEHYEASDFFLEMQSVAERIFNTVFEVEMVMKIIGLKGFANYIRPSANKFDFMIVMSSIAQDIFDLILSGGGDQLAILKIFRLFRALRVVRMLRRFESVRLILDAALGSLQVTIIPCTRAVVWHGHGGLQGCVRAVVGCDGRNMDRRLIQGYCVMH